MNSDEELLFFDTFSHVRDSNEDINLDLVQFPHPVYLTECRIIPLGARVEAEFPGGTHRLGATNPSQFNVSFFINDLTKTQAPTFETLGGFEYNENELIHFKISSSAGSSCRGIPTDGLVLKGEYTTVTLAVYGILTKNVTDPIPETINSTFDEQANQEIDLIESQTSKHEETWSKQLIYPSPSLDPTVEKNPFPLGNVNYEKYYDQPKDPRAEVCPRSISPDQLNQEIIPDFRGSVSPPGLSPNSKSRNKEMRLKLEDWTTSPNMRSPVEYDRSSRRDKSHLQKKRPRTPTSPPPLLNDPVNVSDDDRTFAATQPKRRSSNDKSQSNHPMEHMDELRSRSAIVGTLSPVNSCLEEENLSSDEQFEPILSDEDIGDDANDNCFDEFEFDVANEPDSAIMSFDPHKIDLKQYFNIDVNQSVDKQIEHQFYEFKLLLHKCIKKLPNLCLKKFQGQIRMDWLYLLEIEIIPKLMILNQNDHQNNNVKLKLMLIEEPDICHFLIESIKIAVNYDISVSEPLAHGKYIKTGLNFIQNLVGYNIILEHCYQQFNIFEQLFNIYSKLWSSKYGILKTMYSLLNTKVAFKCFFKTYTEDSRHFNAYKHLLHIIDSSPNKREMHLLKALVEKIHLYETLDFIAKTVEMLCSTIKPDVIETEELETALLKVYHAYTWNEISYLQLERFLPVSAIFSINKEKSAIEKFRTGLFLHFDIHSYLESLATLINMREMLSPRIIDIVLTCLHGLLQLPEGLDYFYNNIETTNLIMKSLLDSSVSPALLNDEAKGAPNEDSVIHKLGLEVFYKIQTIYYLNAISSNFEKTECTIDDLQALFSLACGPGKSHVVEILTMNQKAKLLLDLIDKENNFQPNDVSQEIKCKSAILSYSVDLVDITVRFCKNIGFMEEFGHTLHRLVKQHEHFEPTSSAILQEMAVYLKPIEIPNLFKYDINGIQALIKLLQNGLEFISTFPGDLIVTLRIISYLGIPPYHENVHFDKHQLNSKLPHIELKYCYMIKEFYSADGTNILITILDKLNNYFEQPAIHASTLSTNQGVLLTQILLPTVQIFNSIIALVIQERNIEYKDLTSIEILLKTYSLMHYIPVRALCYKDAVNVKNEIIKILLAYTQPLSADGVDTRTIHGSLWTLMISELIKFIMTGPHCFVPGLLVFAELLPLPLPLPAKRRLTDEEMQRLITQRQLWSAHLHPQGSALTEMIHSLCGTSHRPLIVILSRVCLQLSDLAPNMTLLVSKCIFDLISTENSANGIASSQLERLFGFLASLTSHSSIKVSIPALLNTKFIELVTLVLSTAEKSAVHIQAQENILIFLQNMLDSEITLFNGLNGVSGSPEMILACAVPSKEYLQDIAAAVVETFCLLDTTPSLNIAALKTMLLMTEHDYTILSLRIELLKKRDGILTKMKYFFEIYRENNILYRPVCTLMMDFLIALISIEEGNYNQPSRTIKWSNLDMCAFLNYFQINEQGLNNCEHVLDVLFKFVKTQTIIQENISEDDFADNLKTLLDFLNEPVDKVARSDYQKDLILPQAEGIVTQFASRPILKISNKLEFSEQLGVKYWLTPPFEQETISEQINVDLLNVIQTCLSPDTNIYTDCKRLLHLSASPQSNRDRATAKNCFRTRRVEVEPTTGRPEKKLYVTPSRGRGFSRGDLFRNRPANTSRPPSLHVDDFLALETGYSKLVRGARIRGRGGVANRATWYSKKYSRMKSIGLSPYTGRSRGSRNRGYPR